jgi:hypothetical protein
MNFLVTPELRDNSNAPMDQEQLDVVARFVEELLELRVLRSAEEGIKILLNAPSSSPLIASVPRKLIWAVRHTPPT